MTLIRFISAILLTGLLVIVPSPTPTISLVQSITTAQASGTSNTCTLNSATVAAGDLLIVAGAWGGDTTATFSASDGTNSYTQFLGALSNNGVAPAFFTVNSSSTASLTITMNATGGGTHSLDLGCFEYNYSAGAWIAGGGVDQHNANNDGGADFSGTAGSVTPTASPELIFSVISLQNGTATGFTVASPMTTQGNITGGSTGQGFAAQGNGVAADDQNATTSAVNPSFSWLTTSGPYGAVVQTFNPASTVSPRRLTLIGVGQ